MKGQYVSDLTEGTRVDSEFALRSKDLRLSRSGEGYLVVELGDRTGDIPGVMFRPARLASELPMGSVVRVRGVVTSYRGQQRVSIDALQPAERYRREDMVPGGTRDRGELLAELKSLVAQIADPTLAALVRSVFSDRTFAARFLAAPSSASEDHPYVGGLLEHTVGVAVTCSALAEAHPQVDRDELVAAALLHDIGKVDALAYDTTVETTEAGRLLGHVALGHARLLGALASLDQPVDSQAGSRLCHALLAHHDDESDGGIRPVTLEALLLAQADRTDRACSVFLSRTMAAARAGERWTARAAGRGRALSVPGATARQSAVR